MEVNGNSVAGMTFIGAGAGQGISGWLAQNATVISLSLTASSVVIGAVFLYMNYSASKKHNARLVRIAERELELKEKAAQRD